MKGREGVRGRERGREGMVRVGVSVCESHKETGLGWLDCDDDDN